MIVYEITIQIFLTRDIQLHEIRTELAHFIDSYLVQDEEFAEWHQKNCIKGYVWSLPTPIERGMKVYKKDKVYEFRIRTVDFKLMAYFVCGMEKHETDTIKAIERRVRQIHCKPIAEVYTLTPYVLRDAKGRGYWRDCMPFTEFEVQLKKSLIHQYEMYTEECLEGDFPLFDQIEILSKCAVKVPYKGISLLGDKLSIQVSDNKNAQKVLYFALGNGLSMGARGLGFLGYRYV